MRDFGAARPELHHVHDIERQPSQLRQAPGERWTCRRRHCRTPPPFSYGSLRLVTIVQELCLTSAYDVERREHDRRCLCWRDVVAPHRIGQVIELEGVLRFQPPWLRDKGARTFGDYRSRFLGVRSLSIGHGTRRPGWRHGYQHACRRTFWQPAPDRGRCRGLCHQPLSQPALPGRAAGKAWSSAAYC